MGFSVDLMGFSRVFLDGDKNSSIFINRLISTDFKYHQQGELSEKGEEFI